MGLRQTLELLARQSPGMRPERPQKHLASFNSDCPNPGGLNARIHVPDGLPIGAALVVVLHGCTQSASAYDAGTGWSCLADREGFALLFPEQSTANNAHLCFNWFQPGDVARCGGEAESIAQLAEEMVERHSLDRERVFVTGLSAGGSMAAVMLATYPDLFAGGAIIGGLPYGAATGVGAALRLMAGRAVPSASAAADNVRRAPGFAPARWPTVSLWHGTADHTVVVGNVDALAAQWCGVHGADLASGRILADERCERQLWSVDGRNVVESRRIPAMGHGVPVDPSGPGGLGRAGPYMLATGIDSTTEIARGWGLVAESAPRASSTHIPAHVTRPPSTAAVRPSAPVGLGEPQACRRSSRMRCVPRA